MSLHFVLVDCTDIAYCTVGRGGECGEESGNGRPSRSGYSRWHDAVEYVRDIVIHKSFPRATYALT